MWFTNPTSFNSASTSFFTSTSLPSFTNTRSEHTVSSPVYTHRWGDAIPRTLAMPLIASNTALQQSLLASGVRWSRTCEEC